MAQEKNYEVLLQTLNAASQLPLVKIKRDDFLRARFKDDEHLDYFLENGPQSVYTSASLRKIADQIIKEMTTKTSAISFAAGLPGNPLIAVAAGGADVVQYFGFALNMAQQIAYLFGEDDLFNGDSNDLSEEAKVRIIAYLGVMFAAAGSAALLTNVSKKAGVTIGKRVAAKALTRTTWYPLMKKVGSAMGAKVTKKTVEKTITKSVPLIGGVISGGLTYVTFRPMGGKLADTLVQVNEGSLQADPDLELNPNFVAVRDNVIDADFEETSSK